jgi:streptomycin 6-kinase
VSDQIWFDRWHLRPDGESFESLNSRIHPVRTGDGESAVLKIAKRADDERTAEMLGYYGGIGAVRLLRAEGLAVLMERADGPQSLRRMALNGEDEAAARIIGEAVVRLHGIARPAPRGLPSLESLFRPLFDRASESSVLGACAVSARTLLADPRREVLHGDIHHENILDSDRGWLAIDPKGRLGPPQYDLANTFFNPIFETHLTNDPERMVALAGWLRDVTGHSLQDLLIAAHAHAGLSACWFGDDRKGFDAATGCAEAARVALDRVQ